MRKACAFITILLLFVCSFAGRSEEKGPGQARFQDTISITVVQLRWFDDGKPDKEVRTPIRNKNTVKAIVSAIKLKKAPSCMCEDTSRLEFKTKGGVIKVSFCSGCFDVLGGANRGHYYMPNAVYRKVKPYLKR
jgi:hypothetical protein